MALASSDERDLLLPLFAGYQEESLWETFLRRLLARTAAKRISLFVTAATRAKRVLVERLVSAPGSPAPELIEMEPFADSILFAQGAPRPNRVYSLEELLIIDDGDAARQQRHALARAGIAHARFIRIPAPADHTIWLFLMHDRHDFGAADSALLSALAPHVALAFGILLETDALRLRAAMAEEALALIGVGQAAFDADGRVIANDTIAAEELDLQPSARPQLRAREAQALNEACAGMAGASPGQRRIVRLDERIAKDMLLRPAPTIAGAAAVGLLRQPRREDEASAARVITSTLGLSAREAALAEAMSQGRTILTAGAELQLTPETARNYSKRIYAKTGAAGQADLVRLLLTGLAPFA
jgi:DNA-binding CsgD family transcriptional regulator